MSDPTADRITAAFAESIRAGECGDTDVGMPGAWVFSAVYHDADGEERTMFLAPDGQPIRESLGLLDAAQVIWREELRRWVLSSTEDD